MTTTTKATGTTLEDVLAAAGIDVAKAKKSLAGLDESFGGYHGDIPEGALRAWADGNLRGRGDALFLAIGRAWEQELAAALSPERKAERELSPEDWIKQREKAEAAKAAKK